MKAAYLMAVLFWGGSLQGWGAIRHDVLDEEYRRLAELHAEYQAVALLLDAGKPEASAVLIDPRWVLTAGHEVDAVSSLEALRVRVDGVDVRVDSIVRHPEYREKGLGHGVDLALLRLSTAVEHVAPAGLYVAGSETGRVGTTVGFGVSGTSRTVLTDPEPTGTLRAGRNVVDQIGGSVDGRAYPANLMIADFDSPTNPSTNRVGSARPLPLEYLPLGGDSGGGLFINVNGEQRLAGIVSALTPRVNDEEEDGLYGSLVYWVRLSLYAAWIADVTAG